MRTLLFWSGLFGAAVAIQGLSVPAYCEMEEKGRGMMGEHSIERLTEKLDLSEAQQKKVKAILAESKPEMEKLHAEMKAVADKMKAAMRKTREAIRETLDMEQKEKFDALSVKMRMMRHGHGQAGPQGAPKWVKPQREEGVAPLPRDEGVAPVKNEWMEPQPQMNESVEPRKTEREPENDPDGE
jgi:Spy/CpxP family protein refolding chaperone